MSKLIDLSGQYFGYWKVIERSASTKAGDSTWLCECKCGTKKIVLGKGLRTGKSRSCGCMKKEELRERRFVHGKHETRLYRIWHHMILRITNENEKSYKYYGGRGITVCKEWSESFVEFEKWAIENGYAENLTIDRIDNNKGYSPDNCRWATRKEQSNNTRRNYYLTYQGETKTISEWAKKTGISKGTLRRRIVELGWSAEKALTTKVRVQNKKQP